MKTKFYLLLGLTAFALTACMNKNDDFNPEEFDKQVILDLVNQKRTEGCNCGTTPFPPVGEVVWNDTLEYVAKNYSIKMKNNDFIDYTMTDAEYDITNDLTNWNYNYTSFEVNVAKNYIMETNLINYWFEHRLFCERMMNADAKEIGVALSGQYATIVLSNP